MRSCFFVDDENGAFADSRQRIAQAQHAVSAGHFAVRIKIAGRVGSAAGQFHILPCDVTKRAVHADAHDLGIHVGKLVEIDVVCRHLSGSSGRPIERIERNENILLSLEVAELEAMLLIAGDRDQIKIRGGVSTGRAAIQTSAY